MVEIYQLVQLLSIAKNGTLSKAAEEMHLTQPSVSRSMQKLEDELHVTLFERQKNKITLNQNGKLALEYAQRIVSEAQNMAEHIRALDRSHHTISVGSCAPAPLWDSIQLLSSLYPNMTISYDIKGQDLLVQGFLDNAYHVIILPKALEEPGTHCVRYGDENLFFSLPPEHALANEKGLSLADMDGETILLHSKVGFWYDTYIEKMPLARFLVQNDRPAFSEREEVSELPALTSDIMMRKEGKLEARNIIPILDKEAHVTHYCVCHAQDKHKLAAFFERLEQDNP